MTIIRITSDICTQALVSLVGAAAIAQHEVEDVVGDFFGPDVNVIVDDGGIELEAVRTEYAHPADGDCSVILQWKVGLPTVYVTYTLPAGGGFRSQPTFDAGALAFRVALSGDGEAILDVDDERTLRLKPAERKALIEAARKASLDLRAALSRLVCPSE